jgi:hypothetical protein
MPAPQPKVYQRPAMKSVKGRFLLLHDTLLGVRLGLHDILPSSGSRVILITAIPKTKTGFYTSITHPQGLTETVTIFS